MDDEAYDRLESLGEWHAEQGIPEPSDDEYWDGVDFGTWLAEVSVCPAKQAA